MFVTHMWEFLESIENSGFSTWVRETPTVLGYSTVLALHTFGMAFLVGLSGAIALRVLGIAPELPLAPLKKFFPLIVAGFWLNAATGVVLTSLAARSFLSNPDFYIKLTAIAFAIVTLQALRTTVFGEPANRGATPKKAKILAGAMLTFWAIAVTAGRLTAYSGFVRRETAVAVSVLLLVLLALRFVALRIASLMRPARHARAQISTSTNN